MSLTIVSSFGNNFTVEILNTLTQAQLHKHMSFCHTEWNLLLLPPKPCWASSAKEIFDIFFFFGPDNSIVSVVWCMLQYPL